MRFNKQKFLKILPFIGVGFFFNKASQAFTSASGSSFGEKFIEAMNNFGSVFSVPLPSFRPVDLFIGTAGAVLIKAIVWIKGKNAKKYRKGVEYGSARYPKIIP